MMYPSLAKSTGSRKLKRHKTYARKTINLILTISHNPFIFLGKGMKGITKDLTDLLCKVAGHRWRYKDYTNWIKEDGKPYDFKASRYCTTCKKHGYYSRNSWIETNKKNWRYDVIDDECFSKDPPLLRKSRPTVKHPLAKNSPPAVHELMKAS